jgi:Rrf2 family iron-sulfur cluster assembly transcriptional regulator
MLNTRNIFDAFCEPVCPASLYSTDLFSTLTFVSIRVRIDLAMKLTRETNVALDALTHLARQPPGAIVGAAELAAAIDVSPAFLSKILQRLSGASIVRGHRGRRRGYSLALPPDQTSVRAVAEALEGESLFGRCVFWTYECSDVNPCPLHDVWKRVRPLVREEFTRLTIAELARRKSRRENAEARVAASAKLGLEKQKKKRPSRRKTPAAGSASSSGRPRSDASGPRGFDRSF